MGTGKSRAAKILSDGLEWQLADTDRMMERETGKKIADIYKEAGPEAFAEKEMQVINHVRYYHEAVIAMGGNYPMTEEKFHLLSEYGLMILLYARPFRLAERVRRRIGKRPTMDYSDVDGYVRQMLRKWAKWRDRVDLVINTTQQMDRLSREIYIQSKSFDEVVELCKKHDDMLASIPAIQPVSNKNLKQTASGYGTRIDPIYKTVKFHAGMDFSANVGTPVYATGNGKVVKAGWEGLYGNCIDIDHGFGYVTKYAHLSKIKVRAGQQVMRGEIIGEVGSTGKSTGPHLHYEVHVKGQIVNPVNYYFMDLSADDYDKMVEIAANHGKVFD